MRSLTDGPNPTKTVFAKDFIAARQKPLLEEF